MSSLLVLINGTKNKIEGKADRTAKGYKFIYPIFSTRQNVSLHQGLEKLSENRINGYSILNKTKIKNIMWLLVTWQHLLLKFNWKIDLQNKFDLKGRLRILLKLSFSPLITSAIVRYISKVTN